MGYEVHITRADDWTDSSRHPIPEAQWNDVVARDPTLQVSTDDYYERKTPDGGIERFHPVVWLEHPDKPAFWFIDGAVDAKCPDERTVSKMMSLAASLDAKLIDDEGEVYAEPRPTPPPVSAQRVSMENGLRLEARRLGKAGFILRYGILRRGLPVGIAMAVITYLREHGPTYPHTAQALVMIAYWLLAGSFGFGIWCGISQWNKLHK